MPQLAPLGPGDPTQLGPFTLRGRVGEGGQGVVYLGEDESGDRAAIKLLHVKFTGDAMARSRFARELRAAQRVASFCTARVIAADLDGDTPYIASEYIDGPSLRETVETSGPLSGSRLDRLAVGTATALTAIHEAGIVHRDFKPDNVLIAADGPRVVDFGIARIIDSTGTITSRAVGTPAYMAPEQISGDTVGPPTDVFAWGATIAYAATGKAAFGGDSIAAVLNRILNHDIDVSSLPEPLRSVVQACVSKNPTARPTADQILLRLLGRTDSGGQLTAVLTQGAHVASTGEFPAIRPHDPPKAEASTVGAGPAGGPPIAKPRVRGPERRNGRRAVAVVLVTALVAIGGVVAAIRFIPHHDQPVSTPSPSRPASSAPSKDPSGSPSPGKSPTYASIVDKAYATKKLTIGVKGDLPGVGLYTPSKGTFSGFEIDLARFLAEKLGVPPSGITFKKVSRFDRVGALQAHTVDLVVATYAWEDYKNDRVTFAGPYFVAHTDVLLPADSPVTTLADLDGKRLCSWPGSASPALVTDQVPMELVKASDHADCMNKLKAGLLDAIPGDDMILAGFAAREDMRFRLLHAGIGHWSYAVAVPDGDVRACEAIRPLIGQLYDSGRMATLIKRHFGGVGFSPPLDIPAKITCR
ncbi:transporter substrate-binding domain-containing protein [Streptosporangiaceae bacterium NEAU-GS5]|nr:transporter substrate-binding domain-containing protein [Streptosporangiaceae bacterium NEAU-GS5]